MFSWSFFGGKAVTAFYCCGTKNISKVTPEE